jgi:hypothetical protein
MHLFLSLPTLLPSYPVRFRIKYCLALFRPVASGDFRSPEILQTLALLEYFSYRMDKILKITMY